MSRSIVLLAVCWLLWVRWMFYIADDVVYQHNTRQALVQECGLCEHTSSDHGRLPFNDWWSSTNFAFTASTLHAVAEEVKAPRFPSTALIQLKEKAMCINRGLLAQLGKCMLSGQACTQVVIPASLIVWVARTTT